MTVTLAQDEVDHELRVELGTRWSTMRLTAVAGGAGDPRAFVEAIAAATAAGVQEDGRRPSASARPSASDDMKIWYAVLGRLVRAAAQKRSRAATVDDNGGESDDTDDDDDEDAAIYEPLGVPSSRWLEAQARRESVVEDDDDDEAVLEEEDDDDDELLEEDDDDEEDASANCRTASTRASDELEDSKRRVEDLEAEKDEAGARAAQRIEELERENERLLSQHLGEPAPAEPAEAAEPAEPEAAELAPAPAEPAEAPAPRRRRGTRRPAKVAHGVNRRLDHGKAVFFQFKPHRSGERSLDPSLGADDEEFEFEILSPFDLLDDDDGSRSLYDGYQAWRRHHSIRTEWEVWNASLADYMRGQQSRYLASLTLLEVDRPNTSVVCALRVQDSPAEYPQPVKFGDAIIVWSPNRDNSDKLSFADRSTASAPVVSNLLKWLSHHRVLSQRVFRTDAADTDQQGPLSYDAMYRKLFQKARVR
ncbi:hypothetical protein SO694_00109088 [Aureococcus anophagefferens]|uniref:START domain-containing protein n=1 Tax=Aureococcus anophagefferens TaxID=44056 RepID=A0ABR1FM42_AURAN